MEKAAAFRWDFKRQKPRREAMGAYTNIARRASCLSVGSSLKRWRDAPARVTRKGQEGQRVRRRERREVRVEREAVGRRVRVRLS